MKTALDDLHALASDFQYIDTENGRIVLTVGIRASFYFWGGHTPAVRAALVECIEAYETAFGSELNFGWSEAIQNLAPIKTFPTVRQLVAAMDEDDSLEWFVSSGEDFDDVGLYRIEADTERGWYKGRMSQVSFTLPREHGFDAAKRKVLLDLIELFAALLKPYHGHAGLAALASYSQEDAQSDELDIASRYFGLYIEPGFIDINYAPDGLKSVDWMTFVGSVLAERAGGLDALSKQVSVNGIEMCHTADGLFVFSGERPDIAPVTNGLPPITTRINAIMRPLRNGSFGSMGFASVSDEMRFNRCSTDLWIRRLDAPGIWPPSSFLLPRAPFGVVPRKKIRLTSGDVCSMNGRYQNSRQASKTVTTEHDDPVPLVVLLPGDMAPYQLTLGPHGEFLGRTVAEWEMVAQL